jgi:hypothetical protein
MSPVASTIGDVIARGCRDRGNPARVLVALFWARWGFFKKTKRSPKPHSDMSSAAAPIGDVDLGLQGPRESSALGKSRDGGKGADRKRRSEGQEGDEERVAKRGRGPPGKMDQRGNGGGASVEGRGKGGKEREKGHAERERETEKERKSVVNIKKLKEELRYAKRALYRL